jgi:hypothetical protein
MVCRCVKSTFAAPLGGGGGSRIGRQPSLLIVKTPVSEVLLTTGKSVQFSM